jgi:electron transfer flavoprotein alpha subunit
MNRDIFVLVEHVGGQVTDLSFMLLAQARQIVETTGGRVHALLLGNQAQALAYNLAADQVWYIEHPALEDFNWDAYQITLAGFLKERLDPASEIPPRLVLFGDSTIGADLAGFLSVKLGLPLVSSCLQIQTKDGQLTYLTQFCGGKMMAEGSIPEETTLVMLVPGKFKVEGGKCEQPPNLTRWLAPALDGLRVSLKRYVQPPTGDVDISRQTILVAVGRGLQQQDNLSLATDLAEALNTAVCASRPVIDQNWLPTTRLVGKSGKTVKPKVYLAFGISGAPEHTEAITGSEMVIAINTDPAAPIFDLARYGSTVDMLDLLPVLTEKIQNH